MCASLQLSRSAVYSTFRTGSALREGSNSLSIIAEEGDRDELCDFFFFPENRRYRFYRDRGTATTTMTDRRLLFSFVIRETRDVNILLYVIFCAENVAMTAKPKCRKYTNNLRHNLCDIVILLFFFLNI